MILDNLHTTQSEYGDLGVKFAKAFRWLRKTDLASLKPDQKIEIDGNRIFAQVQGYETLKPETAFFETHRSFVDIQVVAKGREIIQWAPLAKLGKTRTPFDPDKDIEFFEEPAWCNDLKMEEGDFAVFFPSDGHKPRCRLDGAVQVLKVIVKVSV